MYLLGANVSLARWRTNLYVSIYKCIQTEVHLAATNITVSNGSHSISNSLLITSGNVSVTAQ